MELPNVPRAEAQIGPGEDASTQRQRAVWIASYPKSGNTWVRVFIHNLLREMRGQGEAAQDINALHEMTERETLAERFTRRLGKPPQQATPKEIAEARMHIHAEMVRGEDGPIYVKTHNAVANVEGFPTINFDVTLAAVYVVRNPLDVAVSYSHFSGLPADPHHRLYGRTFRQHRRKRNACLRVYGVVELPRGKLDVRAAPACFAFAL